MNEDCWLGINGVSCHQSSRLFRPQTLLPLQFRSGGTSSLRLPRTPRATPLVPVPPRWARPRAGRPTSRRSRRPSQRSPAPASPCSRTCTGRPREAASPRARRSCPTATTRPSCGAWFGALFPGGSPPRPLPSELVPVLRLSAGQGAGGGGVQAQPAGAVRAVQRALPRRCTRRPEGLGAPAAPHALLPRPPRPRRPVARRGLVFLALETPAVESRRRGVAALCRRAGGTEHAPARM